MRVTNVEAQTLIVDKCHRKEKYKLLQSRVTLVDKYGLPHTGPLPYQAAGMYVADPSGVLWYILEIDGDIYAVHPQSQWDPVTRKYYQVVPD